MKLLLNTTNANVAHVDVITLEYGVLNTYANEQDFWNSQAPIATQNMVPSADYDTLTERAISELGPDWVIVEK